MKGTSKTISNTEWGRNAYRMAHIMGSTSITSQKGEGSSPGATDSTMKEIFWLGSSTARAGGLLKVNLMLGSGSPINHKDAVSFLPTIHVMKEKSAPGLSMARVNNSLRTETSTQEVTSMGGHKAWANIPGQRAYLAIVAPSKMDYATETVFGSKVAIDMKAII